jgi:F0F1-type ATP synthase beta subunit
VELHESGSKYLSTGARELAKRASGEIDRGNVALAKYLSQPFFVAEPWTSTPGVTTDREEMLLVIHGLLGIDPVKPTP